MTEINPYIRRAWYDTLLAGAQIGPRLIFDYELLYIKDGVCTITVEDRVYAAQKGDIFLFRPKMEHTILVSADTPLTQPHIHFDLVRQPDSETVPVNLYLTNEIPQAWMSMFRPDILLEMIPALPDFVHPNDTSVLEQMITDVIYAHANCSTLLEQIKTRYLFLQLLHKVLYEMQLVARCGSRTKNATAQRIKMYIDHNNHRSLSLKEIAEQCYISKCYMVCAFKEAYGITPYRYHQRQRIDESKYMLRFTSSTVSEIARAMGFEDIHAFSALFKHLVGLSPSQCRVHSFEETDTQLHSK